MNRKIIIIVMVLIFIAAAIYASVLLWQIFFSSTSTVPIPVVPKFISFTINKPNFLIMGENLYQVNVWAIPTGTDIKPADYTKIGDAKLIASSTNGQTWSLPIPTDPMLVTEIFAQGYSQDGTMAEKISLPLAGATEIYNGLWGQENNEREELNENSSGRFFSYQVASEFSLVLNGGNYPKNKLVIKPAGIIKEIPDNTPLEPPLYRVIYQGEKTGDVVISDKNFSLNIKIYDQAGVSQKYENLDYGISFDYSVRDHKNAYSYFQYLTNNTLVRIDLPANDFLKTNLAEAALSVGASRDPQILSQCLMSSPNIENEQKSAEDKIINGRTYAVFNGEGVGAGNYYETISYRTVNNKTCYEAVILLHSGNILNYPTEMVNIFDRDKILGELTVILNTLVIK